MANSISSLKSQRQTVKGWRREYLNRKRGVRRAYSNRFGMDYYSSSIRNLASNCTIWLSTGIQGIAVLEGKCEVVINKAEKHDLSSDDSFSDAMEYLRREMDRCDDKISGFDSDISWYETQIRAQGGHIYIWE